MIRDNSGRGEFEGAPQDSRSIMIIEADDKERQTNHSDNGVNKILSKL